MHGIFFCIAKVLLGPFCVLLKFVVDNYKLASDGKEGRVVACSGCLFIHFVWATSELVRGAKMSAVGHKSH